MKSALGCLLLAAPLWAGAARHVSSYDIRATYDAAAKTLTGSQTLTWWNDSPDTVPTLQFHLYMNAFKNEKSTFVRESGGRRRGDSLDRKHWGYIDIKRLHLQGGADLTKAIRFIAPDDGNADDQTVIEVALPQPVKPGETLKLDIEFVTRFPRVSARTGFHDTFLLAAQWFPKIGVWETAGFRYSTAGRWNCHQFHGNSEFYSNFGRYRVELNLPSNLIVGATGEMTSKQDLGQGRTAYVFEQEDVTDFAWTAQPNYIRTERMFVAERETTPAEIAAAAKLHGIPEAEVRLSDVKMIVLQQPEHASQIERTFTALRAGLKHFGLWYGRYPYRTITVVDPPHGGDGAGGMEYPTFITAGTLYDNPADFYYMLELVVVHEFGHQFWKELIATNEFEESWLDEGFNTYSSGKIMDGVFGPSTLPVKLFGIHLGRLFDLPKFNDAQANRASFLRSPAKDSLVRNAWQYYDGNSYANNSYTKTGVALNTLERVLGAGAMARLMRAYHQKWRYRHPSSRDFRAVAEEVSGRNLGWFFDQFVFAPGRLDYKVGDVSWRDAGDEHGLFDTDKGRVTIDEVKDKSQRKETTVKVMRDGDSIVPVEVKVTFDDGSSETAHWDGAYRWQKFRWVKKAAPVTVEIDPSNKYLLDVNRLNNSWRAEPDAALTGRWSANLLFWAQNALLSLGWF